MDDTAELTDAQQARRRRILDAASQLADAGGYDAVQMREVAARADVALATLYRYFPSKEHLLVSVMLDSVRTLAGVLEARPPKGDRPVDRVVDLLQWATRALQSRPQLTAAMVRAFLTADPSVAPVVRDVRDASTAMITRLLEDPDGPLRPAPLGQGELSWPELVARILQYTWMASLTTWMNGVEPAEQVARDMEQAARLLLE